IYLKSLPILTVLGSALFSLPVLKRAGFVHTERCSWTFSAGQVSASLLVPAPEQRQGFLSIAAIPFPSPLIFHSFAGLARSQRKKPFPAVHAGSLFAES